MQLTDETPECKQCKKQLRFVVMLIEGPVDTERFLEQERLICLIVRVVERSFCGSADKKVNCIGLVLKVRIEIAFASSGS